MGEGGIAFKILTGKPTRKIFIWWPRHTWEDLKTVGVSRIIKLF
jgi:hypothetical protein